MAVSPSRESSAGGFSAAISGIGRLSQRISFRNRNFAGRQAARTHRSGGPLNRRKYGLAVVFHIDLRDFGLDLGFEFVRSPLELVKRPANLPANLGQLLGPEKDQGKKEQENHLWKTQVHDPMILPERIGGNLAVAATNRSRRWRPGSRSYKLARREA